VSPAALAIEWKALYLFLFLSPSLSPSSVPVLPDFTVQANSFANTGVFVTTGVFEFKFLEHELKPKLVGFGHRRLVDGAAHGASGAGHLVARTEAAVLLVSEAALPSVPGDALPFAIRTSAVGRARATAFLTVLFRSCMHLEHLAVQSPRNFFGHQEDLGIVTNHH
jgi:hypothetical protein